MSVVWPGELLRAATIIDRVEAMHPGRWPRLYLAQYVCHTATRGRLERVAVGTYQLPEE